MIAHELIVERHESRGFSTTTGYPKYSLNPPVASTTTSYLRKLALWTLGGVPVYDDDTQTYRLKTSGHHHCIGRTQCEAIAKTQKLFIDDQEIIFHWDNIYTVSQPQQPVWNWSWCGRRTPPHSAMTVPTAIDFYYYNVRGGLSKNDSTFGLSPPKEGDKIKFVYASHFKSAACYEEALRNNKVSQQCQ